MKKKKIWIPIVIIVALLVVGGIFAVKTVQKVSQGMKDAMQAMAGNDTALFTVEKQEVEQTITTSGNVMGLESDAYVSPVTAKVKDVPVEEGQTVKKGDILLTYDESELGDNLERVEIQAETERAAGNQSYEAAGEAAGKVSAAKKKVKTLEDDIKKLKKEVASLQEEAEEYQEELEAASAAQAQVQIPGVSAPATEETAVSETENEEDEEEEDEDEENLDDLKKSYKKVSNKLNEKSAKLAEKQSSLAEQKAIISANEDVKVSASAQAQINASNRLSQMNVESAQDSLAAARAGLTAEHDGIVEMVNIMKGTYANETMTVMTVIRSDRLGVEFAIAKDDLGSIALGQKARVDVSGNMYEGTVEFISRIAGNDGAYAAATGNSAGGSIKGRILIDNPDDRLFVGVSAKVYIEVGTAKDALVVPFQSVNTDIDGDFVLIVNDENLIERRDVKVGLFSDEYCQILEGVSEGDKVIRAVTADMKPGDEYTPAVQAAGLPMGAAAQ